MLAGDFENKSVMIVVGLFWRNENLWLTTEQYLDKNENALPKRKQKNE